MSQKCGNLQLKICHRGRSFNIKSETIASGSQTILFMKLNLN